MLALQSYNIQRLENLKCMLSYLLKGHPFPRWKEDSAQVFAFGGLIFFNVGPPSYKPTSSPKQVETKMKKVIRFTVYSYYSCISPLPLHSRPPPAQVFALGGLIIFFNVCPPSYCTGVLPFPSICFWRSDFFLM